MEERRSSKEEKNEKNSALPNWRSGQIVLNECNWLIIIVSTDNPGILMLSAFALIFDVPVLALNLLYTAVPVLILDCRNL